MRVLAAFLLFVAGCLAHAGSGSTPLVDEDRIYDEVAELQDRAVPLSDKQRKAIEKHMQKGIRAHDDLEYERAMRSYRKVLGIDPLHAPAHYEIALSQNALGQTEAALESVVRTIAIDPKLESAYVLKGSLEDDLGHPDLALATYDRLLELNPKSYLGLINKGITLLKSKGFDEAEALFLQARDAQPQSAPAYLWLAQCMRMQQYDYDERGYLERFIELGGSDPRVEDARTRLEQLDASEIGVDPTAPYPQIETATQIARARWKTSRHRELDPDARGYRLTYAEEEAVLRDGLLRLWRAEKERDPSAAQPYYDFLLRIDDAGFFEEFVYHQKQNEIGEEAKAWLVEHPDRIEAFLEWARASGLTNEKDPEGAEAEPADDDAIVFEEADLPGLFFTAIEESDRIYEIHTTDEAAGDFFESESAEWSKYRFPQGPRLDCDYDLREVMAQTISDHTPALVTWAKCHHPNDAPWGELQLAGRIGFELRDLTPATPGRIRAVDADQIEVHVSTESAAWLFYLLAKAALRFEPWLCQRLTGGDAISLDAEVLAIRTAVAGYRNSLEGEEPDPPDPYFERLVEVHAAGMIEGFVAFEILHKAYGVPMRRLEPELAAQVDAYLRRFVFRARSSR